MRSIPCAATLPRIRLRRSPAHAVPADRAAVTPNSGQTPQRANQRQLDRTDQRKVAWTDQRKKPRTDQRKTVWTNQRQTARTDQRQLDRTDQRNVAWTDQRQLDRTDQRKAAGPTGATCLDPIGRATCRARQQRTLGPTSVRTYGRTRDKP